jgi:hypothetical protein
VGELGVGPDSRRGGWECQQSRGSAPPAATHPARSCATARAPVRCKRKPRARGALGQQWWLSQCGRLTTTGRVRLSSAGVAARRTSFGAGPRRSEWSGTSLLSGFAQLAQTLFVTLKCTGCDHCTNNDGSHRRRFHAFAMARTQTRGNPDRSARACQQQILAVSRAVGLQRLRRCRPSRNASTQGRLMPSWCSCLSQMRKPRKHIACCLPPR